MHPIRDLHKIVFFILMAATLACGCKRAEKQEPVAIPLIDLYKPEMLQGKVASQKLPPVQWRFDGTTPVASDSKFAKTYGWQVFSGIADLKVQNRVLVGKSADGFPMLHLETKPETQLDDYIHSIVIRARVSAGQNLSVLFSGAKEFSSDDAMALLRGSPLRISTPLLAGDKWETYTLRPPRAVAKSTTKHIVLSPTDVADTTFEIESVRLIFRKEHLASISSGVSWQGMKEIYHESFVSRSPETIEMKLKIPPQSRLDLAIGTIEDGPVEFRVAVKRKDTEVQLLQRTITSPYRWERVPVSLDGYANEEVSLLFTLNSDQKGSLGFWGSPVIRRSGAMPSVAEESKTTRKRPQGIILIWADTLRRDHLSVYGYHRKTSPWLEAMAAEGTLFQDCIVQATWTKVSTPSLMTSLYPSSHGVLDFMDRLPASATTMAEIFRNAGYATLSMSSILFTGQFTNLHQGFEEMHEDGSLPDQESSKTAREYLDRLIPWLDQHRNDPFFVLYHISDPHDPYKPYPPYDTMWADPKSAPQHEQNMKEVRKFISDPLLQRFGMPTHDELVQAGLDPNEYVQRDRDWYDGSIRAMDAEIGRLMESLKNFGLRERTLVIFVSDHGEEFLDHGRMFHGQSVYGELTNVPLILWMPGTIQRGVITNTVEVVDLMPTILEFSGLNGPAGMQGQSLMPLLNPGPNGNNKVQFRKPAFTERAQTSNSGGPPPRDRESYAIVLGGWKLIHNTKRKEGTEQFELYDHVKDPLNKVNLAAQKPEIVAQLLKELEAWSTAAKKNRLKPDSEATKGMSQEELERLRSLGYIQ